MYPFRVVSLVVNQNALSAAEVFPNVWFTPHTCCEFHDTYYQVLVVLPCYL